MNTNRESVAYRSFRLLRYPLEVASSLEVLSIVLYIYAYRLKNGTKYWFNTPTDRTISLRLARTNVSEPLSSVMDIDGNMELLKKLMLKRSFFRSLCSNKLRTL